MSDILVAFQEEELKGAVVLLFANKQVLFSRMLFFILKCGVTFLLNIPMLCLVYRIFLGHSTMLQ